MLGLFHRQGKWEKSKTCIWSRSHFNLFELRDSPEVKFSIYEYWQGDASLKPDNSADGIGPYIVAAVLPAMLLGALVAIAQFTHWPVQGWLLTLMVALSACSLLGLAAFALKHRQDKQNPSPKQRAEQARAAQRQASRDLTLVLEPPKLPPRSSDRPAPKQISRERRSLPLSTSSLPRDRLVYVTLKDLTDAEQVYLNKRLLELIDPG